MLVLEICEPGCARRVVAFTRHTLALGRPVPQLTIGRDAAADLVLRDDSLLSKHAELFERDGLLHLQPLGLTVLNGQPCNGPRVKKQLRERARPVRHASVIAIGESTVALLQFHPIAPPDFEVLEHDFLDAIRRDGAAVDHRLVYADALEERGWLVRAEYMRIQVRLLFGETVEGDEDACHRFLRTLVPSFRWVEAIGEPTVASRCALETERSCPVAWGGQARPSLCLRCHRAVPYAPSARLAPLVDGTLPGDAGFAGGADRRGHGG